MESKEILVGDIYEVELPRSGIYETIIITKIIDKTHKTREMREYEYKTLKTNGVLQDIHGEWFQSNSDYANGLKLKRRSTKAAKILYGENFKTPKKESQGR